MPTLKIKYNEDFRRINFESTPTFDKIVATVQNLFSLNQFNLSYIDDEGDKILVSSDLELQDYLQSIGTGLIKLEVTKKQTEEASYTPRQENTATPQQAPADFINPFQNIFSSFIQPQEGVQNSQPAPADFLQSLFSGFQQPQGASQPSQPTPDFFQNIFSGFQQPQGASQPSQPAPADFLQNIFSQFSEPQPDQSRAPPANPFENFFSQQGSQQAAPEIKVEDLSSLFSSFDLNNNNGPSSFDQIKVTLTSLAQKIPNPIAKLVLTQIAQRPQIVPQLLTNPIVISLIKGYVQSKGSGFVQSFSNNFPTFSKSMNDLESLNLNQLTGENIQNLISQFLPSFQFPVEEDNPVSRNEKEISYQSRFVTDVTIEDGTKFESEEEFVKIWKLQNNGNCSWPDNTQLKFIGAENLSISKSQFFHVGSVGENHETDIIIPMISPTEEGDHVGYFVLVDNDFRPFGSKIWVKITVENPTKEVNSITEAERQFLESVFAMGFPKSNEAIYLEIFRKNLNNANLAVEEIFTSC